MGSFALPRSGEGATATPTLGDSPVVDSGSCQLLGPTALIVQGLMGILVILSLVYKRHREKPMRLWRIWLFDVSKQVVGQMFVHGVNVLISGVISELTDRNACVFYFLNIGIDTTLGVGIIYGSLHSITHLFSTKLGLKGFESGVYGDPPSINYWFRQTAIYLTSLFIMKIVVIGMFILIPGIFAAGEWLLSWTRVGKGDALQVIFVMGIFPIAMNILQFWLIDSIVKAASTEPSVALDVDGADPLDHGDREPLFNASDDEDDGPRGHRDIESQISPHPSGTTFNSYTTGATTPDDEESKSLTKEDEYRTKNDHHSYPPSLVGSLGSTSGGSSNPPREAKNLMKKAPRAKVPPAAPQVSNQIATSNHSSTAAVNEVPHHKASDSWAVPWEDDGDDGNWGESNPKDVKAQEHDRQADVTPIARTRRLS